MSLLRPLLLAAAAAVLAGCGFEEPPPPSVAGSSAPAPVSPPQVQDPCASYALTLLDGQLQGLPSVDPATSDRAGRVADEFQARYDEVIVASGIEAARAQYTDEITTACAREAE